VKFKDADLVGIPWRLVVGRDASEGIVELVQRKNRDVQKRAHPEAIQTLMQALRP
jgi:prolyl-tRNA synthetase